MTRAVPPRPERTKRRESIEELALLSRASGRGSLGKLIVLARMDPCRAREVTTRLRFRKRHTVTTKERLAAMAGSVCALCSGAMASNLSRRTRPPANGALQLRTYACVECGHSRTYSVDGGDS
jgi:hypothetical protein